MNTFNINKYLYLKYPPRNETTYYKNVHLSRQMKHNAKYCALLVCSICVITSMNCKKNTVVSVESEEKKIVSPYDDFFPLNIGREFTFTFVESFYAGSVMGGYSFGKSSGRLYWKVISKEDSSNDEVSLYKYTISQVYYDSASSQLVKHNNFFICEDKYSSQLTIGNNLTTFSFSFPKDFKRFYTKDSISTIIFGNFVEGVTIKKDSGIVNYGYYNAGITLGIFKEHRLVEIK